MTCYFLLNLLMVVQIRILDNSDHCLEMYSIINIILYITNQYLTNEQVIEIVLSNNGEEKATWGGLGPDHVWTKSSPPLLRAHGPLLLCRCARDCMVIAL